MWYMPSILWKPLLFTDNPLTRILYPKVFLSPSTPLSVLEEFYEDNEDYLRKLPASTFRYERFFRGYDATVWLHEIKAPTLVVVGKDDSLTPSEENAKIHELIDGSRLVVIDNAGHLVLYEKTDELNWAIMRFLGDLLGKGALS